MYEAQFKTLKQPFFKTCYNLYLVTCGNAVIKIESEQHKLKKGTLFLTYPYQSYRIDGDSDFQYMYVAFEGKEVEQLLASFGFSRKNYVFYGFDNLINFWIESIRRFSVSNGNALTESVIMYTFSFIKDENLTKRQEGDKFACIMDYIHKNFTSLDFSLKKISSIYFYTEKYFSYLFKLKNGENFTNYVNGLRISLAKKLLRSTNDSIIDVGIKCGFSDPFYFSKVFKKLTGVSPKMYARKQKETK